jgi:hypothetical protein
MLRGVDRVLVQQGPPWIPFQVMREERPLARTAISPGQAHHQARWRARRSRARRRRSATVGGRALETPDEAWDAWRIGRERHRIKLAVVRDGAPLIW